TKMPSGMHVWRNAAEYPAIGTPGHPQASRAAHRESIYFPSMSAKNLTAAAAGSVRIGEFTVNRMGFGALRITGPQHWGEPADREEAKRVVRRAYELGVNFIDTADSYGPHVSEQ